MNVTSQLPSFLQEAYLIPLAPYSKVPCKGVRWRSDETYDLEDYPDSTGYAIDTERSGLVVIDCDTKNGVDGVSAFLTFVEERTGDPFVQTLTVETPNDGLHIYFRTPPGVTIKSSASTFLKGVDVRAAGGYIVGPGSRVKVDLEDGEEEVRTYLIENEDVEEIPFLPDWLVEELGKPKEAKSKDKGEAAPDDHEDSTAERAERRRAVYWAQQKMSDAQAGERQQVLNKTAYFLGRKRVEREQAQNLINIAVDTGLPQAEAEASFNHGYEDGVAHEELEFDSIVKEYNSIMGKDIKKDPAEPAYYTHVALSHNFADAHGDEFIYWAADEQWYCYNEVTGTWDVMKESSMAKRVDAYLDELVKEIRAKNTYLPPYIYKIHEKLWSKSMVESVTAMVRHRYLAEDESIFNKDPELLNCKNGVVNLRTGELLNHSKSFYMTQYIGVDYDPNARDRYCDKVISSIHPDEADYLQLLSGQALTGYQPNYQAALFLHGRGSNGKSTFIDLLLKTSGTYGKLQAPTVFIADKRNGENYALADFENLRTAVIEELPNAKTLDTGALKRLVGTQKLNARAIYSRNKEILNQSTIFVSCNKLPMVNETDEGTWRRVLVFTFPYSYKKSKSELEDPFDRVGDPRVLHAAQNRTATAVAFLAWRVEGARRWFADDRGEYKVPTTVSRATEEWNGNNDLVLAWFRDTFTACPETRDTYVSFEDALKSFNDYLDLLGHRKVSARYFTGEFNSHRIFKEAKLEYRKTSTVSKDFTRSVYKSKEFPQGTPTKERTSYFLGLAFK